LHSSGLMLATRISHGKITLAALFSDDWRNISITLTVSRF